MNTPLPAAEAVKAFKGRGITVQETRLVRREAVPDATGKKGPRDVYDVKQVPLAPEHIIAATVNVAGIVTIVTLDGQKHMSS